MTEQVRYRFDKQLIKDFAKVCEDIGVSPSQAMAMFAKQTVKLGGLPFRPSSFPVLEEYGLTVADVEKAEKVIKRKIASDRRAGKLFEFTGKLP